MSPASSVRTTDVLDAAQIEQFAQDGYLVLPGFLDEALVSRLKPEVDRWVDEGLRARSIACAVDPDTNGLPPLMELEMPAHADLIAYPPLLTALTELLGPSFVFHHLHSDRQAPTLPGKPWHHDYEQRPQRDRTYAMVHALHYLDGLDAQTASLVVLPGSHHRVAAKDAYAHVGTERIDGERVLDALPPGSTVLAHSAVFHARRARPDGVGKDRYFVDASYCQTGTRWPPVKPYWRRMLRRGRELGIGGQRWPHLFDEEHFEEYRR